MFIVLDSCSIFKGEKEQLSKKRVHLMALIIAVFLILLLQSFNVHSQATKSKEHCSRSCGDVRNISYPFRVKGDPKHCGDKRYELSCDNKIATLSLYSGKFYVQDIDYNNYTIRLVDVNFNPNNCSSTPFDFLSYRNFITSLQSSYTFDYTWDYPLIPIEVVYMTCDKAVNDLLYLNVTTSSSCIENGHTHNYALVLWHEDLAAKDVRVGCHVKSIVLVDWENYTITSNDGVNNFTFKNVSYSDIHTRLLHGFHLSWLHGVCEYYCSNPSLYFDSCYLSSSTGKLECHDHCYPTSATFKSCGLWRTLVRYLFDLLELLRVFLFRLGIGHGGSLVPLAAGLVSIALLHALKVALGAPFVIILLFYKWRRRHLSLYENIEEFLQNNDTLMPIRYSYKDIKNITHGFKDKLGEGGFGAVFKGKLRSKQLVAVKMLISKSKSNNGQDFMSEVGTIGRIHHVNIVRLIGYCVEGTKRALVYEFMPNGSLDKYIFSKEDLALSLDKIFEISIGVAQGIAYLHEGCDMRILHFDLKPHNILLDENFKPKVSDFGLAKLYPVDESIVPLTAARGTIGYMAPELYYKNIGGVSHKADVYSFGMLLLEMAGRRRNLNAYAENSSQIYFPSWVYHQFIGGNEVEITDATIEEKKLVKKMIIVAFWCIQMKPTDRPSMKKVAKMLESELEYLPTPPKPFISVADLPSDNALIHTKSLIHSLDSDDLEKSELESESLIMNAT